MQRYNYVALRLSGWSVLKPGVISDGRTIGSGSYFGMINVGLFIFYD